jgi:hypothetical protein
LKKEIQEEYRYAKISHANGIAESVLWKQQ